jgi:hypothetical protein
MSALCRPLRETAARTVDSRRRHGQLDIGLVVLILRSREKALCSWNVHVGLEKRIQCPVFIRMVAAKLPPEAIKSCIFGCVREESASSETGGLPRCASTLNAKAFHELALCHPLCGRRKQPRSSENTLKSSIINNLSFAFK